MITNRPVAYDCRYFLGDRPCIWHKRAGSVCECDHYERVTGRLVIIKLDAMGDVLRTTCLLPPIKQAWPGYRISWVTRPDSVPLLRNNPFVDEIIPYGADAMVQLAARRFDRLINLDAGITSAGMAAIANAAEKTGYVLDEAGSVRATNLAAEEWLKMGVFDDLKKANTRTYQDVMCGILGLPRDTMRYVFELTDDEIRVARKRLQTLGIDLGRPVVGIHTGGGGRWRLKQWTKEGFLQLIRQLTAGERAVQVVLFGGPLERAQNEEILRAVSTPVFDTGCENEVRHFAALTSACTVMLSGDSLAMHVALAVGIRTVVIFGPTSYAEIELFGMGEKVVPDLDCLVCYKQECDFIPNCMESIPVRQVKEAVLRQVALAGAPPLFVSPVQIQAS